MMKRPEHSLVVSSREDLDLDPSLSHRCVQFFPGAPPPRTNPSAPVPHPVTIPPNFPSFPLDRRIRNSFSMFTHSPKSPSAESFHRPSAPTAAAVMFGGPGFPSSIDVLNMVHIIYQSSHLVMRRTMQGRGGYLPSQQALLYLTALLRPSRPVWFLFSLLCIRLLAVFNALSYHWGMMEEGGAWMGFVIR